MGFIVSGLIVMLPMGLSGARSVAIADLGCHPRIWASGSRKKA